VKNILLTLLFILCVALTVNATNYYASPTGTGFACSLAVPCSLQTGLGQTVLTSSDTLYLRGGTYSGKFRSKLNAGTVRSYPGEWAIIDGLLHTTLTSAINASQVNIPVANTSILAFPPDFEGYTGIFIGGENIQVYAYNGSAITDCNRGAGGSIGGAASHPNGADVYVNGNQLFIQGNNTTYRDFELTNTMVTARDAATEPESSRGNGIHNIGDGNKFINIVTHDGESGYFSSADSSDSEVYGLVSYNNGLYRGTDGVGHGMYLENGAGFCRIYNNILLNNFNLNTQCFGQTAPFVGGDIQKNVYAGAGSPIGKFNAEAGNVSLLVGTNEVPITSVKVDSNYFYNRIETLGSALTFGYGAGINAANNSDATVTNNYFVGGFGLITVQNTNKCTVTGNKVYSNHASFSFYTIAALGSPYTWNNNTYYAGNSNTLFGIANQGVYNFTDWKTQMSGFDTTSTAPLAALPDTVIIQPNAYETGRANLTIYNTTGATSVNVNLSTTGLVNGQGYVIKNAFNYSGSNVATGTYNSSSPTISVAVNSSAATSVAKPIGTSYNIPTTAPYFFSFIVIPSAVAPPTTTVNYFTGTMPPIS
jgi:hypothetical protein